MSKRKVFIAIHQLNIGGAQKALISALNAIDYTKNDVTLYVRKNRLDLLPLVNNNVKEIIINEDRTRYDHKPYSLVLTLISYLLKLLKKDCTTVDKINRDYVLKKQIEFEKTHYFSDNTCYDLAISFIHGYTSKVVAEVVNAKRKIMFYFESTDSLHKLHSQAMKQYDRIFCDSKLSQKALKSFYPEFADKIYCLENYVDAEDVRKKAEEFKPYFSNNKLLLCSCGRITPVKGFDLAVEAADLLRNKGVVFKWYFVGDGSDRAKIENLIESKQLEDYIEITGLQSNPYPYIKNCDIYVQPSYEESQGLTMVEAKVLCKPVITTATAGGKCTIAYETTGLICDINPSAISDAIIKLAHNNELRAQITKNLSMIDYEADYKRFCRQWAELLGDK